MGLLDGNLPKSIYRNFRGKLLRGVALSTIVPENGTLDALGDPEAVTPTQTAIEGFTEAYSRFSQAQIGIPATDLKLHIFAASAPGFVPMVGTRARLDRKTPGGGVISQWYQVRGPVQIDPAGVLWTCQSFEIPPPQ